VDDGHVALVVDEDVPLAVSCGTFGRRVFELRGGNDVAALRIERTEASRHEHPARGGLHREVVRAAVAFDVELLGFDHLRVTRGECRKNDCGHKNERE